MGQPIWWSRSCRLRAPCGTVAISSMEYEAAKIPEYWLLDQPRREAYFYVLDAEAAISLLQ